MSDLLGFKLLFAIKGIDSRQWEQRSGCDHGLISNFHVCVRSESAFAVYERLPKNLASIGEILGI